MDVGAEMNALVARRVLSLEVIYWYGTPTELHHDLAKDYHWRIPVRPYSTEIGAAWQVVEAMQARCWRLSRLTSNTPPHNIPTIAWECDFRYYATDGPTASTTGYATAEAPTAPLAICRAALAALDREDS